MRALGERLRGRHPQRARAALVLCLGLALLLWTATAGAQSSTDYDIDDDGLIEVVNLEQLSAIRWDREGDGSATDAGYAAAFPNPESGMGCPTSGCAGYELMRDLDFNDRASYADADANLTAWTTGEGWEPIITLLADFIGNGHIISNLYINRPGSRWAGLFGQFGQLGIQGPPVLQRVGLVNVNITTDGSSGALVGLVNGGTVRAAFSTGQIRGNHTLGGLVGSNGGSIIASYSTVTLSSPIDTQAWNPGVIGGLVGENQNDGAVIASYASGAVSVRRSERLDGEETRYGGFRAGGLVGSNSASSTSSSPFGRIVASYSRGAVSAEARPVGGLVGNNENDAATFVASYFDSDTGRQAIAVGSDDDDGNGVIDGTETATGGASGQSTRALQSPTGYTSIFADWDADLDGDGGRDDFWDFGTSSEYPVLRFDFNGDGRATWQEFGHQGRVRAPPSTRLPLKLIYRSVRTDIAEDGATEFWFPVRGRDCDPPDPSRCGWLSIPADLRDNLDNRWNPVSELATDVYTALDPSPDSTPRGAPGGVVKLELWAVFPHPERGTNSVSKVAGPYTTPFTICMPSPAADRVIQVYDRESREWTNLEQVEAEHEGHVCGLTHDLGYIALASP